MSVQQLVLHEAGYKCANPVCRMILTLEIHHLEHVSAGGSNKADNLLPLCPNCHSLHHKGVIPIASLRVWKRTLLALNEAFDRAVVDLLLMLDKIADGVILSGDGIVRCAALVASDLVRVDTMYGEQGDVLHATYHIQLSPKGKSFVEAWKEGKDREASGAA